MALVGEQLDIYCERQIGGSMEKKSAESGAGAAMVVAIWSWTLLAFTGLAMVGLLAAGIQFLPITFFTSQDLPVAVALVFAVILVRALPEPLRCVELLKAIFSWLVGVPFWLWALAMGLVALTGAFSVLGTYPLSMDEYWGWADGTIFLSGRIMAEVPSQFRDYASAMFPVFARSAADGSAVGSTYLPINALLQGLLGPLCSPVLSGGAVLCLAWLARRHLPGSKSSAAAISVILGATCAQWIVIGSTTYAMSAHLFFNLLWLCLVFSPGRLRQVGGVLVAFLATGLHQFAFFPVFAGFFVTELFLSGRRAAAAVQAAAILASVAFWMAWPAFSLDWAGGGEAGSGGASSVPLATTVLTLITANDPVNMISVMGFNLVRLHLWTNPLLVPLVVLAAPIAWKEKGIFRAAMLSCLATVAFMALVMPYQGHGWGYRYLHQQLGSMCLLAGLAWCRLGLEARRGGQALFAAATLVSLVLVPLRYWQAIEFAQPYALANTEIAKSDADVVIVDAPSHMFSIDLVRNVSRDPTGPVRMAAGALSDDQLKELCQAYKIEIFDGADAERAGIASMDNDREQTRNLYCINGTNY